jgi:PPP family 3-phenylpropionic acid transporter
MSLRLALFYAAFYTVVGVQLPFWPVWLAARGMDAREIGILLSVAGLVRIVAAPSIAMVADRLGRRKTLVVVLAVLSLVATGLYAPAHGFAALLVITILSSIFFTTLMPMGESLVLLVARARALDYGRIRLWGSFAFILSATASGYLLSGRTDVDWTLWLMLGALTLTTGAALVLPEAQTSRTPRRWGWRILVQDREFMLVMLAASVLQATHAVYYGFATLHWRGVGLSEPLIGALWAEGVVAEIVLFAVSAALPFGPRGLLLLSAGGGVARWCMLGTTDTIGVLVLVQALHALTFGASLLAVVRYILKGVAAELSSTAQGIAAAIGSIFSALFLWCAGLLYADWGAHAYFAMALLAAIGGAAALLTRRTPPSPPSPSPASA